MYLMQRVRRSLDRQEIWNMKKKTVKKQYVVVGLGRFGQSVARYLEVNGCTVLAIDSDSKKVNMVSEYVTRAMCVDIGDEEAVQELGLSNFDGMIIAIGNHLESTIFAIIWAKEAGVQQIIAKAYDETQGKILSKVGANEIIYPEREMGYQLAKNLAFGKLLDAVELTADEKAKLVEKLGQKLGRTIHLECSVDPSLLGGLVVNVDGKVIDGSLRSKLQEIKEVMTK